MTGRRVAIFLTSMQVGGIQRVARNLGKGLVDAGCAVDLVLVEAEGELLDELPEAVDVVDLDCDRVATTILPLRNYLATERPDVLYAMMTEINVASIVAHALARSDARLVVSEHNTPTESATSTKDRAVLAAAGRLYPRADHTVAVSRGVYDDLLTTSRLDPSDVSVIHNPMDVTALRERAADPIDHPWLTDDRYDVVISAGRHVPQKGFDTLIEAFAALDDADRRLLLLGEGEQTDELRELAAELGVESRVEFPGYVENPFNYIANADVFVLASEYEGFGMVLVEAMACGCPVVSTECPSGPSEILEDGRYGPLVPVGDADRMAAAIEATLASPPDERTLRSRATDFSVEAITERYESVFFPESVGGDDVDTAADTAGKRS